MLLQYDKGIPFLNHLFNNYGRITLNWTRDTWQVNSNREFSVIKVFKYEQIISTSWICSIQSCIWKEHIRDISNTCTYKLTNIVKYRHYNYQLNFSVHIHKWRKQFYEFDGTIFKCSVMNLFRFQRNLTLQFW